MTNNFNVGDVVRPWYNYNIMQVVEEGEKYIEVHNLSTNEVQLILKNSDIYDELRKVEITEELLEQYPELKAYKLSNEGELVKKEELEKDLNCELDDVFEELVNTERYGMADGRQLYDHIVDMFGEYEASVFYKINAIKYIVRYKHKNGAEDLKKSKVYVDLLIGLLEDE